MQQFLKEYDFNLLKILCSLVHTGSTHSSARQLGINQSTVSRSLKRLRETYGNSLFQRTPHGLEASPLAKDMAAVIDQMLDQLKNVENQYRQFDPLTYRGTVNIVVNQVIQTVYGAKLALQLTRALPQVDFAFVSWNSASQEKLLKGEYHYGIQLNLMKLPKSLHTTTICETKTAIIARQNHPAFKGKITVEKMSAYPMVRLYMPEVNTLESSLVERALHNLGYDERICVKTDDAHALVDLLKYDDAIFTNGSPFFANLDPMLQSFPPPEEFPEGPPLSIFSVYPNSLREQALYQYLDEKMIEIMQE
ncbi:LysR family transcriptional regulator [Motilimonas pumila]|uniref:LysR family transcriptional regulator n=1 Tax=Motilimonas pumila TaxID=2303987 RepID=A0A418YDQ2_9GAMM|nr:LysR family transcriptional regulator [Motilimonas pumila]RJG42672.1 LysR family transcriptional regulator [Motilimonas pumila]